MEVEFNAVKILKLVNKDTLLKSVYNEDNEPFNLKALTTQAIDETLSDDILGSLKSIFDVICNRDTYLEDYNKIEDEKRYRRYGKIQIQKDIIAQDGIATEIQLTMLSLGELKSAQINLQGKGTSDHYYDTEKISVKEGKAIRAAVRGFLNVTKDIRKRKIR